MQIWYQKQYSYTLTLEIHYNINYLQGCRNLIVNKMFLKIVLKLIDQFRTLYSCNTVYNLLCIFFLSNIQQMLNKSTIENKI